jgi:hypothetical protein
MTCQLVSVGAGTGRSGGVAGVRLKKKDLQNKKCLEIEYGRGWKVLALGKHLNFQLYAEPKIFSRISFVRPRPVPCTHTHTHIRYVIIIYGYLYKRHANEINSYGRTAHRRYNVETTVK